MPTQLGKPHVARKPLVMRCQRDPNQRTGLCHVSAVADMNKEKSPKLFRLGTAWGSMWTSYRIKRPRIHAYPRSYMYARRVYTLSCLWSRVGTCHVWYGRLLDPFLDMSGSRRLLYRTTSWVKRPRINAAARLCLCSTSASAVVCTVDDALAHTRCGTGGVSRKIKK